MSESGQSTIKETPLSVTVPLALGVRVPKPFLDRGDRRALMYVRWMGLLVGPFVPILIWTDGLIAGTYDPHTEWVRIPQALILIVTALLTFIENPPVAPRNMLFLQAIAWQVGQTANCYPLKDVDAAAYVPALVFLGSAFLVFYEPYKFVILTTLTAVLYIVILGVGLQLPLTASAQMSHIAPLIGFALMGIVVGIATWERTLREWGYITALEYQRALLEENDKRFRKEIHLAEQVQRRLLPPTRLSDKYIKVDFCYLPANNVGGDLLDIIELEDGVYALLIADVSGHGFAPALISSMVKMSIYALDRQLLYRPAALLQKLDQLLYENLHREFITAVYGVLNAREMTFEYATAGHEAPLIVRQAPREILSTFPTGRALGVFPHNSYTSHCITLQSDDVIYLFTDGCFEIMRDGHELLAMDGLLKLVADSQSLPFEAQVENVITGIRSYSGGIFNDDITLLACTLNNGRNAGPTTAVQA
ncbi:MAG: PP2C family protein-serine/threonine phosphatase [Spirochaetia bacterium]|nr:PP2C family protein-serine/threonine phosphatase [Spirochaetia bacterium]